MPDYIHSTRRFRAMNTDVTTIVCSRQHQQSAAETALRQIELMFRVIEKTCSRFDPESELSALNNSSGRPFKASPVLFQVVSAAVKSARITRGIYDPTILPQLLAAGYNCSFEKLGENGFRDSLPVPADKCSWQDIQLHAPDSTIWLPENCRLDLGGIGKGWALDEACESVEYFPGYVIDAGGDIRLAGTTADGNPWKVGIADPFWESRDIGIIALKEAAVCTSTVTRRKWLSYGRPQHHLIDPRTGRPAESGIVSATVIAETAVKAETLAKSALILGPTAGQQLIEDCLGAQGLFILQNKQYLSTAGFPEVFHAA